MTDNRAHVRHRCAVDTVTMHLLVDPRPIPVQAELKYDTHDPHAVSVTFTREGHTPVVWVFSRELLITGIARPTGSGDVQVRPAGTQVILTFTSPTGSARLAADRAAMRRFAAQTTQLVQPGNELDYLDMDAALTALTTSITPEYGDQ